MASQGLASWLSGRLSACASATSIASDSQPQDNKCVANLIPDVNSPLDISFAQLCAKDTMPPMSVGTRSLVEEIESEADDAEFDERAHWSRRSSRKKARASRRAAVDALQPSIARFCVKEQVEFVAGEKEEESDGDDVAVDCGDFVDVVVNGEEEEKKIVNRSRKTTVEIARMEVDSCNMEGESTARMSSGRPKRQAVVRAEIFRQKQKLLDAVAARNEAASFLTPPPSTQKTAKEGNATTSGRKRKLEMNKKIKTSPVRKADTTTSSPGVAKTAQSFFLSEQEKKQLQEIETVSSFREQLRQTREKDLAFFAGKTASPFFQARACVKSSGSADDDDVEMYEDGGTKQRQSISGSSRWGKPLPLFPDVQHVVIECGETEGMDRIANDLSPLKKVLPAIDESGAVIIVDDDAAAGSKLTNGVMDQLKAAMNGQVTTESSFSEQFWFREYLDASSLPARVIRCIDVTSPRPAENADAGMAELMERQTLLIDDLVETHGMREKRVRELLEGLEQARAKRSDHEQNLSLVDRYLPVNASGLVGNCESLHTLSSWLSAWKVGGGDREKLNCLESELFAFEDGDSDSEDEVGDLCRLFILEGESGAGKSAAVYACAEELGYEIIEINAAQNRSGKSIVELVGEATQSARVLHVGTKEGMRKKKHKKKKKKKRRHSESRKSLEQPTAASLSLVMFEDADLVFDEDKGFLTAVCSIAKHSKCPIVVTCSQLPDAFPAKPGRLCRELRKPSMDEFATWMRLVAFIEGLQLAPSLIDAMGNFFKRDVRRSLHFLEANLLVSDASKEAQWCWQHVVGKKDASQVNVPAWTLWTTGSSSFDALTSNLLSELAAATGSAGKRLGDKSREEKQVEVDAMAELAQIIDAVSVAEVWMAPTLATGHDTDDTKDSFFHLERQYLAALELRRSSLYMLGSSASHLGASLMQYQGPVASKCVQRTLDSALAASRRWYRQTEIAELKAKFELPLAYKGCGTSEPQFTLDYMPMVGRLLCSTGLQEGRRRASRRNHYLSDVLGDMSLIDDLPAFNTYLQSDMDQLVATSPTSPQ